MLTKRIKGEIKPVETQRRKPLTLPGTVMEGFIEKAFNLELEAGVRVCLVEDVWVGKVGGEREGSRYFWA